MADNSDFLHPALVYLDDPNEYDAIMIYKWFLASAPERLTCRPINFRTEEEIIIKHKERMKESNQRDFAVRRTADNCLVGRVTYFDVNHRNRTAEIGFLTNPDFRRKGYALEAMKLLLDHLFGELGMNKVMAQTGEFNEASIALMKKLGFKQDGRLRQHHEVEGKLYDDLLFSILAEEAKL
jgi:ribosomal-protein-alanine N-acetyltransferase